jgi:hypothetical protein
MAFTTPEDLQDLIAHLNDTAKSYNPSPDPGGFKSRVQIIEKAKKIAQTLIAPADMGFYHCLNVSKQSEPSPSIG